MHTLPSSLMFFLRGPCHFSSGASKVAMFVWWHRRVYIYIRILICHYCLVKIPLISHYHQILSHLGFPSSSVSTRDQRCPQTWNWYPWRVTPSLGKKIWTILQGGKTINHQSLNHGWSCFVCTQFHFYNQLQIGIIIPKLWSIQTGARQFCRLVYAHLLN